MNDPRHVASELARIRDLLEEGHYDDALQTVIGLQQMVEGTAGAQAFLLRGSALLGLGQPERAERSFRTAYSIVRYAPPSEIAAQRILAEAAERIGLRDEAILAYQAVLQAVPDDSAAKTGIERLAKERGKRGNS